jgi:hypothetical protein
MITAQKKSIKKFHKREQRRFHVSMILQKLCNAWSAAPPLQIWIKFGSIYFCEMT